MSKTDAARRDSPDGRHVHFCGVRSGRTTCHATVVWRALHVAGTRQGLSPPTSRRHSGVCATGRNHHPGSRRSASTFNSGFTERYSVSRRCHSSASPRITETTDAVRIQAYGNAH